MIIPLGRSYPSIHGVPVIDKVDTDIFTRTYFAHCMNCMFCSDSCCQYGVDVDVENVARINAVADKLEPYVGVPRGEWFDGSVNEEDPEFPGGRITRTQVRDGACVFLNRKGRGCLLHSFALQEGLNFNDLKPMISAIFPLTFYEGCLYPAEEITEEELVCRNQGPSLYEGARADLKHFFGDGFISTLDALLMQHKEP